MDRMRQVRDAEMSGVGVAQGYVTFTRAIG
jgi:hypothetical protein